MRRQPYPWEVMTADECQARWADLANREPIATTPRQQRDTRIAKSIDDATELTIIPDQEPSA